MHVLCFVNVYIYSRCLYMWKMLVVFFSPIEKISGLFGHNNFGGHVNWTIQIPLCSHIKILKGDGWGEANMKHDWCTKEDKLQSSIHCFNVSPNRRRVLECGVCNPFLASEMVAMSSFCIERWALPSFTFRSWVVFYLLTPLSDWPIIMINPGGFLLLVPIVYSQLFFSKYLFFKNIGCVLMIGIYICIKFNSIQYDKCVKNWIMRIYIILKYS